MLLGVFPIVLVFSLLPQINLVLCSCTSTKKEFGSIQLLSDLFIHDNAQHSIENLKSKEISSKKFRISFGME
jgi:hypothetical protein